MDQVISEESQRGTANLRNNPSGSGNKTINVMGFLVYTHYSFITKNNCFFVVVVVVVFQSYL